MLQILIILAMIVEALFYWLIGMRLAYGGYSWMVIAPVIGTIAVSWRLLFALPSFLVARLLRRSDDKRSNKKSAFMALAREIDARAMCYTLTQPFHQLFMFSEPTSEKSGVPILLVHGYFSNRGMWWKFRRALVRAKLGPVYSVTLEPLWGSIDAMIGGLEKKIDIIRAQSGHEKLVVVAHSMGGLVTRAWMVKNQANAARIAKFITIGSPHHGTRMASVAVGQCVFEMRIGSGWLAALERAELDASHPPTTSIYTENDDLVVPAESSRLEWAANIAVRDVGHVSQLFSKDVALQVIEKIGLDIQLTDCAGQ
jgi:pimeloyl-ACP methyl ester carboxylesterase